MKVINTFERKTNHFKFLQLYYCMYLCFMLQTASKCESIGNSSNEGITTCTKNFVLLSHVKKAWILGYFRFLQSYYVFACKNSTHIAKR